MLSLLIYLIWFIVAYLVGGVLYVIWMIWVHPAIRSQTKAPPTAEDVLLEAAIWPLSVVEALAEVAGRQLERSLAGTSRKRPTVEPSVKNVECSTCGAPTSQRARYCPRCGAGLLPTSWQDK
jgi:uncharacterized paraquat-inducible protein A